jgi:SAM-dependent methyltransferase
LNPLTEIAGQTDIYLLDLIMKDHLKNGIKILDAGCGGGRNLYYFLKQGFNCFGVDSSETAIAKVRALKNELAPQVNDDHFGVSEVEKLTFADRTFQLVISSAVLHFAKNEEHWHRMIDDMWRVLALDGIFFCRLATSIGIEKRIQHLHERQYLLPDATRRFLANETMILRKTHELGASFLEPLKSTIVENSRTMTTWVLRKRES